jgi:hypothetical protein
MVNVLYVEGNPRGSDYLEELFDEVAHEENIAIFCSFLMDKFDPKIYDGAFGNVCRTHSHVIPVYDYAHHRLTVNRAVAEVVGEIKGPLLQSLVSWKGARTSLMPSSQALLMWVKEHLPKSFEPVLARARELEHEAHAHRPS